MMIKSVQYPCQCAIGMTDDRYEYVMCVIPCEKHAGMMQKELKALAEAVRRLQKKKL